jgi:DNA replicative helicase MCM subunit Mcm2 (Cdc46/Mcm family)
MKDGMKIRGDINIALIVKFLFKGDPGIAKS